MNKENLLFNKSFLAIGEVMIEFSLSQKLYDSNSLYQLSAAGDTFNTSVYIARFGCETAYLTKLGDDNLSHKIIKIMEDESISSFFVSEKKGSQPGIYLIENDSKGERVFRYWRRESPARTLFTDTDSSHDLEQSLAGFGIVYFTGISLAILSENARDKFFIELKKFKEKGGVICFDSNFRAKLWRDLGEAKAIIHSFLDLVDILLVTYEDEENLWGFASVENLFTYYKDTFDIKEIVLKQGSLPVKLLHVKTFGENNIIDIDVDPVPNVIDTAGAGDAFNAGYIAARILGKDPCEACNIGNQSAAVVIQHSGAIVDKDNYINTMKIPIRRFTYE
jgi:2-dehydro-3-deoxygluconokinase